VKTLGDERAITNMNDASAIGLLAQNEATHNTIFLPLNWRSRSGRILIVSGLRRWSAFGGLLKQSENGPSLLYEWRQS
jgi:hypothetical protein